MADITYEVIEHDGGYAYRIGDLISERFPSQSSAMLAGEHAAEGYRERLKVHESSSPNASTQKSDLFSS